MEFRQFFSKSTEVVSSSQDYDRSMIYCLRQSSAKTNCPKELEMASQPQQHNLHFTILINMSKPKNTQSGLPMFRRNAVRARFSGQMWCYTPPAWSDDNF